MLCFAFLFLFPSLYATAETALPMLSESEVEEDMPDAAVMQAHDVPQQSAEPEPILAEVEQPVVNAAAPIVAPPATEWEHVEPVFQEEERPQWQSVAPELREEEIGKLCIVAPSESRIDWKTSFRSELRGL